MCWSLFRVPQSLTGEPKATCAVPDKESLEFSRRRSQSFPSLLGVESSDDGAAAPRPAGGGDGSCDPPTGSADGCACRAGGTRAQGVCGGRVGVAEELPPQRDIGRSAAAPVWRWRGLRRPSWARWRSGGAGSVGGRGSGVRERWQAVVGPSWAVAWCLSAPPSTLTPCLPDRAVVLWHCG